VLDAPELPDDGYLDRAHLTPLGANAMARHLTAFITTRLPPLLVRP
jgi:lysophospholipase L1-like esterase